jgi:hypothetical protein
MKIISLLASITLILSVAVANAAVINHNVSNEENKSKDDKSRDDKSKDVDDLVGCKFSEGCGLDIPKGMDDLDKPPKYEDIKSDDHCNEKSPSLCKIDNVDKVSSVPEPSTYVLFSVGAAGLICFVRRQTKLKNRKKIHSGYLPAWRKSNWVRA